MPIRPNSRYYNNEAIGAGFSNLADIFAPPDAADVANYALGRQRNQQADIIQRLQSDPRYAGFDHQAILADLFDPTGSFYAVDQGNATARRGQDISAQAAITTNRADNQRALAAESMQPISQGQVRPGLSAGLADFFGMPEIAPAEGQAKPMSETEWRAQEAEALRSSGLIDDDLMAAIVFGDTPLEAVVTKQGPRNVLRPDAIGREPVPRASGVTVNTAPNGVDYGEPEDGLVWARNPDGTVQLDERGAPIAVPYRGGSVYEEQQAAAAAREAGETRQDTKSNIVVEDIDRAISQIEANPLATTGLGAQVTGGIGGSPAFNVNALIDTVRANAGFEELQAMREASPTGGALGNVTERELSLLQATIGNLDPRQKDDQLLENLRRVREVYLDIIHGPGNRPDENPAPKPGDVVDGWVFRGGDPGDQANWQRVM